MPPVIAAIASIIGAIIPSGALAAMGVTGTTLPTVPNLSAEEDGQKPTLAVHGMLFPLNIPSDHLLLRQTDASEITTGSMTYFREGVEQEILPALPGVPLFGGDKTTLLGEVTRAWIEEDAVFIEGVVIDRPNVRWHIDRQRCGLCLENVFVEPCVIKDGPAPRMKPSRIFVCVPGQSAFPQTYIRFSDDAVKYEGPQLEAPVAPVELRAGAKLAVLPVGIGW